MPLEQPVIRMLFFMITSVGLGRHFAGVISGGVIWMF
jgi:hypothetical protein